jgi:hypothetical protein
MKRSFKIRRSAISTGLPLQSTLLSVLALDYYKASDLAIGIVGALIGVYWIISIISMCLEDWVDPFEETKETTPKAKSRWMERLEEAMEAKKKAV